MDLGAGRLMGALEIARNDGPWDLAQNVEKTNLLAKYTTEWRGFEVMTVLSLYDNEWRSTDQVPERLVDAVHRPGP